MTIDDTVTKLAEAQLGHEARLTRVEDAFQEVAIAIKQLTQIADAADRRLEASDSARQEADKRLDALINAQVSYEARQERLEEAFRQVAASHAQLVEMLQLHEDRPDGQGEANVHTESRLDALIDAQIQLTQRVDTLTGDISALNGRAAATDERLDRMAERMEAHDQQLGRIEVLQVENATQIKALISAQAGTDEQIKRLFDRRKTAKTPKARVKKTGAKKTVKKAGG
jgi:chromosome segregation ATPase